MSAEGLLAAGCGALIVGGAVLVAVGLTGWGGNPDAPAAWWRHRRRVRPARRESRALLLRGAALVVGLVVWLVSGWPVGGALAGLAVAGVPWLLRSFSASTTDIDRLEALQEWVRRTADVLAAGGGLEQTLIRSTRTAPEPLRTEIDTLAARLEARWPTSRALLALADDLDDAAGDLVVAALLLGAELRGPGLARVLTELAQSLTEEVTMRRKVEADRAKPRANARWLLLITVVTAALSAFNVAYIAPYGTATGQLALALIAALVIGCLLWMRRLTTPSRPPRFLVDDEHRASAQPEVAR